jgi:hypothetical protein
MVVVDTVRILRSHMCVPMIGVEICVGDLFPILICSIDRESIEEISHEAIFADCLGEGERLDMVVIVSVAFWVTPSLVK